MNIVLMEGLGVDKAFLDEQAAKLEKMGHTFTVYEKVRMYLYKKKEVRMRMLLYWLICL